MMEWQFWTGLAGIALGFVSLSATVIACVWKLRGWAEGQFNATRENAHKILEKHEEKDEQRHRENVQNLKELEVDSSRRMGTLEAKMSSLEVQLARINRGGKRSGPEFVAGS